LEGKETVHPATGNYSMYMVAFGFAKKQMRTSQPFMRLFCRNCSIIRVFGVHEMLEFFLQRCHPKHKDKGPGLDWKVFLLL